MSESPTKKSTTSIAGDRAPRRADVIDVLAQRTGARHTSEIAEGLELAPRFAAALGRVIDDLVFDGTLLALPGHRFKLATDASAPVEEREPASPPGARRSLGRRSTTAPGKDGAGSSERQTAARAARSAAPKREAAESSRGRRRAEEAPATPARPDGTRERPRGRERARLDETVSPARSSIEGRSSVDALPRRGRGAVIDGALNANPRGFGFVSGGATGDDVYVPREGLGGALHGDRVRVRVVATNDRGLEGAIEEVIQRRPARFAGTLERRGKSAWIVPDDARLRGPIVLQNPPDAPHGYAVIGTITRFPESFDENPEGVVDEVLGAPGTIEVEARKILGTHAVEEVFSDQAEAQARGYGDEVPASMLEGREDLTHLPLPTIDPFDARDHDDAIWAVRNDDGSFRAWVAIADVSTYVTPGSPIDDAALSRGCSIYLPTRAIPMLPRALSSNLCSLLPDVIRLCLAIEIDLDATGVTTGARVIEGFMRSKAKLTYEGVAHALGLSETAPSQDAAIAMREDLRVLHDVSKVLRAQRLRRGALQFHAAEAKVVLDPETGVPTNIEKRGKDPGVAKAYEIVEELMLLANETVAGMMVAKGAPTIFRNHGAPDGAKLERFGAMCARLGVAFDAEEAADPRKLAAFIKTLRSNPRAQVLDVLLIRSMKQAAYDVANIGHYGLSSPAYLHFTSPIRRYPDVVVHRTLRRIARKEPIDKSEHAQSEMRDAAQRASTAERRAMEVERETVDLYRAFYMRDHVGETFTATVGGFASSGAYVSIEAPFVDVLVKSDLLSLGSTSEGYALDDEGLSMVAARSGDRVDLGDGMLIQIEDVSLERRTVFGRRVGQVALDDVGDEDAAERAPRRSKRKGAAGSAPSKKGSTRREAPKRGARASGAPAARGSTVARKQKKSAPSKKKSKKR